MSAQAILDDARLAGPAGLAGSPDELAVLNELSAAAGTDVGVLGPLTAEIIGRLVAAVVTAILRERFLAGSPPPLELDDLAAQLDSAVIRAWRDLDGGRRPTPAAGPAPAAGGAVSPGTLPTGLSALGDAQLCTLFAVDIANFTRPDRDDDIRRFMHEQLYMMLRKAFDGSGIPWTACQYEDRGDGALVVVPPGVSGLNLVGPLPERLRGLVRRHNHVSRDAAQIQLRAAAHFGLVEHDGYGFVGSDVNLLFRILNAPPLKQALADSRADLALIVSDHIYRSFICPHPSLLSPDAFTAVNFKVGQAEFKAWSFFREQPDCLSLVRIAGSSGWRHEQQRSIDSVLDSGGLLWAGRPLRRAARGRRRAPR